MSVYKQEIDMDAWLDRASRELTQAYNACMHPNVNEAIASIRHALKKYYPEVIEECRAKYKIDEYTLAQQMGLFLANFAMLIYSLRIELIGSPGTAGIDQNGNLYFFTLPFIDLTPEQNPSSGVKPDSFYGNNSFLTQIAYVQGRKQREFDELMERSLKARGFFGNGQNDDYQSTVGMWPDDVPYFDTALVAAYLVHEISHLGFSHFGPSAKLFQRFLANYIRFSSLDLAAKIRQMIKEKKQAMVRFASQAKLDSDELKKLVPDVMLRNVVHNIANVTFDAVIHSVLPAVEMIITAALKKRYIVMPGDGGGGGGGQGPEIPVGEVGDHELEDGDNSGSGGSRQETKRRVIQQGLPQRKYKMRSEELQDKILDNIKEVAKQIGSGTTNLIDSIRGCILSLREDPLAKLNTAKRKMEAMFCTPYRRSRKPRADEVYLRRRGKIGYLPRQVRKPQSKRVMVVIDTSGSMSDAEISTALGFVRAALMKHNYLFTLYVCDAEAYLVGVDMRTLPDSVDIPRGGTELGAAIRDAEKRGILKDYDSFVFITDGYNDDWGINSLKRCCEDPKVMVLLTQSSVKDNVANAVGAVKSDVILIKDVVGYVAV